jgi:3-methyladenine DNA glycosylase AlkD
MTYETLRQQLRDLADPAYKAFKKRIVPHVQCLGVRMPALRRLARQLTNEDDLNGLLPSLLKSPLQEDKILFALLTGYQTAIPPDELLSRLNAFIPCLDNWEVCDLFAGVLKHAVSKQPARFYALAKDYISHENPWEIRFGLVLMIDYFCRPATVDELLSIAAGITHPNYYVKMANAWLLSVLYLVDKDKTTDFLRHTSLDDRTINLAIQKIIDSHQVSTADKQPLRSLRRGKKPLSCYIKC